MEKENQEAKRIQENQDKANAAALEAERQEALRRQRSLENQQISEEKSQVVPEASNEDRLVMLFSFDIKVVRHAFVGQGLHEHNKKSIIISIIIVIIIISNINSFLYSHLQPVNYMPQVESTYQY